MNMTTRPSAREWIFNVSKFQVPLIHTYSMFPREVSELMSLVEYVQKDKSIFDNLYVSSLPKEILDLKPVKDVVSEISSTNKIKHPNLVTSDLSRKYVLFVWKYWCVYLEVDDKKYTVVDCSESIPFEVYSGTDVKSAVSSLVKLFP